MEVAPLRETSLSQLEEVFREEIETWNHQLFWDYRPALKLVKTFLAVGSMPGFALKNDKGKMVGYVYFVIDRPVAFIGGAYVLRRFSGLEAYQLLLNRSISFLMKLQIVSRIEAQLFPFNYDFVSIFREYEFRAIKRFFLSADLRSNSPSVSAPDVRSVESPRFKIVPWNHRMLISGARVVYDSHIGSPDHFICRDYQSEAGCVRLMKNLIDHPACGQFSPGETKLAVDSNGRLSGVLIASRIKPDTGMIPQLSIRRDCQGKGLGSMMMRAYLFEAKRNGLQRVTLSVSQANARARRLYENQGFRPLKMFHAYVWQR